MPVELQVVPVVHGSPSSQLAPVFGVRALQVPPWHTLAFKHWVAGGQMTGVPTH
jgi:hypothetical protein